jgi:hypothetical protein
MTRTPIGLWSSRRIPLYRCRWCGYAGPLEAVEAHERAAHGAEYRTEALQEAERAANAQAATTVAAADGDQADPAGHVPDDPADSQFAAKPFQWQDDDDSEGERS